MDKSAELSLKIVEQFEATTRTDRVRVAALQALNRRLERELSQARIALEVIALRADDNSAMYVTTLHRVREVLADYFANQS